MTASDIFDLHRRGLTVQAYEAARTLYADDKSPEATCAMFWTAVSMLRKNVAQGRTEQAHKILLALRRLLNTLPDEDSNEEILNAMQACETLLSENLSMPDADNPHGSHLITGQWGEDLAADYLRAKGYVIIERDWNSGHRDIVARDGRILVFVEVKTRSNALFTEPEQAVDFRKLKNLRKAILHYLNYHNIDCPWCFDVISVIGHPGDRNPEIRHITDFPIK